MKKIVLLGLFSVACLLGIVAYQYFSFNDGKLHAVFCDVGQGDAIFVRTPEGKQILIDGGPDTSVLTCLSKHMPFWERDIDLMILTHPHADHLLGMQFVLQRYNVKGFALEDLHNDTHSYSDLLALLNEKKVPQQTVWAGDKYTIENGKKPVTLSLLAPTQEFVERTSPSGKIGESGEFASLIALLRYGSFSLLVTGDSQASGLHEAASQINGPIDVLHVPHHGSASGMDDEILKALAPKIAVISVGKKNKYGHPTEKSLNLLKAQGSSVLRTDQQGDVELVSDGQTWQVLNTR